jgi:hypothetical protein
MNFCTTVGVNPWIVFHIATCGGTRLHNENPLAECEKRPENV